MADAINHLEKFPKIALINELKRRGEWVEIDVATDRQLYDQLVKRGWKVKATKTEKYTL